MFSASYSTKSLSRHDGCRTSSIVTAYFTDQPCSSLVTMETLRLKNKFFNNCILYGSTMYIASATCLQRLSELCKAVETIRLYFAERVNTINQPMRDKSHTPFAATHPSNPMLSRSERSICHRKKATEYLQQVQPQQLIATSPRETPPPGG